MAKKAKTARKGKAKKPNYSKGWETRRRNDALRANLPATQALTQKANSAPSAAPESEFAIKARAIIVAARKKGGERAVKGALEQIALQATHDTSVRLEQQHLEHCKAIHGSNASSIVASFMAQMEAIQTLNHGRLPPALMVSGLVMARVTEALARAGYSKHGWKQPDRRDEIMNRSHPVGPDTAG